MKNTKDTWYINRLKLIYKKFNLFKKKMKEEKNEEININTSLIF